MITSKKLKENIKIKMKIAPYIARIVSDCKYKAVQCNNRIVAVSRKHNKYCERTPSITDKSANSKYVMLNLVDDLAAKFI